MKGAWGICPKSTADSYPLIAPLSAVAALNSLRTARAEKAECRAERERDLERETGLEPATFSLEGLDLLAVSRASWKGVHFVSSYRVVLVCRNAGRISPIASPSERRPVMLRREEDSWPTT